MKGNAEDKVVEAFLKEVRDNLNCTESKEEGIIERLRPEVEEFVEKYPNHEVTLERLKKDYYKPEEMAVAFLNDKEPDTVIKIMSVKRDIIRLVLAFCIIAVLCFGAFLFTRFLQLEDFRDGHEVEVFYEEKLEGTPPPEMDDSAQVY